MRLDAEKVQEADRRLHVHLLTGYDHITHAEVFGALAARARAESGISIPEDRANMYDSVGDLAQRAAFILTQVGGTPAYRDGWDSVLNGETRNPFPIIGQERQEWRMGRLDRLEWLRRDGGAYLLELEHSASADDRKMAACGRMELRAYLILIGEG